VGQSRSWELGHDRRSPKAESRPPKAATSSSGFCERAVFDRDFRSVFTIYLGFIFYPIRYVLFYFFIFLFFVFSPALTFICREDSRFTDARQPIPFYFQYTMLPISNIAHVALVTTQRKQMPSKSD